MIHRFSSGYISHGVEHDYGISHEKLSWENFFLAKRIYNEIFLKYTQETLVIVVELSIELVQFTLLILFVLI